jgi:hypothetical protein
MPLVPTSGTYRTPNSKGPLGWKVVRLWQHELEEDFDPPSQWRSMRTTNAIERLREEFKRRIKTQTVLRSADTAAMLFRALLASGQINMRNVDGWRKHTLPSPSISQLTSPPDQIASSCWSCAA